MESRYTTSYLMQVVDIFYDFQVIRRRDVHEIDFVL